jgi:hypothetical protein
MSLAIDDHTYVTDFAGSDMKQLEMALGHSPTSQYGSMAVYGKENIKVTGMDGSLCLSFSGGLQ